MECNTIFMPLGVSDEYVDSTGLGFGYVTQDDISSIVKPRAENAHKGTYGHALLVCGSYGMIGAVVLATSAALRSGCGLVTVHIPAEERFPVVANCPSALFSLDTAPYFTTLPSNMSKYTVVGVGCGLGQHPKTAAALGELLKWACVNEKSVVLDADALNILAENREMFKLVPMHSILTPHLGELKRLTGEWTNAEDMYDMANNLAKQLHSIVIVKGPNTAICNEGKDIVFNSTGNAGMAKGGSGDVLTGFITGLLARGYAPVDAAVLGVYIHGMAGDKAADYFGQEGMNSADIVDFLAETLKELE